jgi:integrase
MQVTGRFRSNYKKLSDGRTKIYYYTHPGRTRFYECFDMPIREPYSHDFIERFQVAIRSEQTEENAGDFAQIVHDFLDSSKFEALSEASKINYRRDLRLAVREFGTASIAEIEDRSFRGKIARWHLNMAATSPKGADNCVGTLSAAFGYAYRMGTLVVNPAYGIQKAWKQPVDREPWTKEEIDLFLRNCPKVTSDIFHLAMYTGLRRADLASISWDAYNGSDLQWRTSKSRGRRIVIVPLTPEGKAFIENLKTQQESAPLGVQRTMLISAGGTPMTPHTLGKKVIERAKKLGITKKLHRLRSNYASLLVTNGFERGEIAGIMGWSPDQVDQLIRIYVHRDVIVAAQAKKLQNRHF